MQIVGPQTVVQSSVIFTNLDWAEIESDPEKKEIIKDHFKNCVARAVGITPFQIIITNLSDHEGVQVAYKVSKLKMIPTCFFHSAEIGISPKQ